MCLPRYGRIVEISSDDPLARVAVVELGPGRRQPASLACVPSAGVGDWVMLHAGLALTVLDGEEARARAGLVDRVRGG